MTGLPDFLIVGAQKAGTSWLMHMLRQHPQIFMPGREIHFFNKSEHYDRGLAWYRKHFRDAAAGQVVGEKTPNYLWVNVPGAGTDLSGSHERIASSLPDVRVIAILRDPVERAVSAYNHHLSRGRFPPYRSMNDILFGRKKELAARHGVLSMGCYHVQLSAYFDVLEPERVLVLGFEEDVARRPRETLARVCHFLGVDEAFEFDRVGEARNVRKQSNFEVWANYFLPGALAKRVRAYGRMLPPMTKRTPDSETREKLVEYYRKDAAAVRALLDRPFAAWQV